MQFLNPSPAAAAPPMYTYPTPVPAAAAGVPQLDTLANGKVPPGFDASTCRSVYVGNINSKVTESMLADIFSSLGPLEGCKLIRKEKSSYGFVDYFDPASAQQALISLNGRQLFGQPIKVNWAFQGGYKEDTSAHVSIFVGDLGNEITDAALFAAFSIYSTCVEAKVMWDKATQRSKGYGFVTFRGQQDAENAIVEMTGKWIGSRQVRCNWATRGGANPPQQQQQQQMGVQVGAQQVQNGAGAAAGSAGSASDASNGAKDSAAQPPAAPGAQGGYQHAQMPGSQGPRDPNTPQFTTVYVGNLSNEASQIDLHRLFFALGVGIIEEVKVNREKGFGFVRYSRTEEAAAAIHGANGMPVCGRPIRCSWGSKPTMPSAAPPRGLPPPPPLVPSQAGMYGVPPPQGAYGTAAPPADMMAYQQQMRAMPYGMPGAAAQGQPNGVPQMGMPHGMSMGMGAMGAMRPPSMGVVPAMQGMTAHPGTMMPGGYDPTALGGGQASYGPPQYY